MTSLIAPGFNWIPGLYRDPASIRSFAVLFIYHTIELV